VFAAADQENQLDGIGQVCVTFKRQKPQPDEEQGLRDSGPQRELIGQRAPTDLVFSLHRFIRRSAI